MVTQAGTSVFAAKKIEIHIRPAGDSATDLAVTVEEAIYNSPGKPPLTIDSAQLLGTVDAKHELTINDLQLHQSGFKLWGKGSLSLDDERRIQGLVKAETDNVGRLLTVLDPYIELPDQDRTTLKLVLSLFGKKAKADLVAREGQLFIGPVRVGELLPLY
ncbi:MAG TPA: DUF2125 domain-containing protein [Aestuariivirga sp.]|nr:DUF2125 domain-containing protein [Aestuariivirga sp.]